ncbi:MAG: hypothetical protein JXA67_10390 [Micromonosporaceae bacterium]|nr:hypothetical protein [Micromonosporaceae bacterium]
MPYPTDDEVNQAMADTDCLMLPYRWASHSGQLEHAFDLGVLPVASQTGSLTDQVLLHGGYVDPPIWFDWTDGAQFTYGERLLTAMQQAHRMIQTGWHARDGEAFRAHRVQEHASVMEAHRDLYQCNLQGNVR